MANSDKDIKITPNTGSANLPKIEFTGQDNSTKTLSVANSGALSFDGDLTVTNLSVSGTTTTVDSTTVTLDDPILTLGGDTAPSSDDNKDRGIEFRYHTGSAAAIGFMGYDDSAGKFTMLTGATNSSEVFSGTKGTLVANVEGNVTGNVTGNADTVTTNANLTGDITSSGNATSIASGVIVNADVNASAAIAYSKLNLTGAILNADLAGSIAGSKLATGAVDTTQLAADAVTTAKIADDQITTATIADDAVTTATIADDQITTATIADDAITTATIADNAITTATINDSAVTGAKVSAFAIADKSLSSILYQTAGESGNILVNSNNGFPTEGVVSLESELIRYKGVNADGRTLDNCSRGYRGTTAAGHTANGSLSVTLLAGKEVTLGGTKTVEVIPFVGSDGTNASETGLVPATAAGDNNKYLRGDGSWQTLSGGGSTGTVTSIAAGTGLSGGTITTTGTIAINAAQTGITSLLATDIKIGEDNETKIDFETADEIHFYAANAEQVYVADGIFGPQTDSDVDLGSTSVRWKDAFVDSITVTGEVDGASLDISGNADIDGTLEADAITIGGTAIAAAGTTSITTLGTITTGTWNGTAIASGYIAADAITGAKIADDAIDSEHITAGAVDLEHLSSESVDEDNLYISNAGSDGQYLQKQSGNNGGLTWASVSSGDSNAGGVDGSAGAPTFSFASDTNTGMYRLTGDTLAFSVGGSNAMYMQSSKVEANKRFEIIAGSNTAPGLSLAGDDNTGIYRYAENQIGFTIDGTAQLFIKDGAIEPVTDNDIDLGTSSKEFKDGYFDGTLHCDVLDLAGTEYTSIGGASVLNELTDVISNTTNFTDSILISPDGAAPPQGGTLSSADNNVGIGKDVFGDAMTSGHSNIAIGTEAGKAVTSSHESVYIGHHSGKLQTYGSDNVGIGAFTLDAATSGGQNVAVGHSALSGVTGSNSNVAVGYFAGSTLSNQTNNTLIGRDAGRNLNSANNVIVGSMAGDGISNGGNNTLIGYAAGGALDTGADNIAIGTYSGDALTTGSGNVVIGRQDPASNTGDNQLVIGNGQHSGDARTWILGNDSAQINSKVNVVAVSSNTTLTNVDASTLGESGAIIYWTGGTLTLPYNATPGTQYTIINNTGSADKPGLNSNGDFLNGTHGNIDDKDSRSYICVASGNTGGGSPDWWGIG